MSRQIKPGSRLSKADKQYILERSWLRADLGVTLEDLSAPETEDPSVPVTTPPERDDEHLVKAPSAGGATATDGSGQSTPQDGYEDMKMDALVEELKSRELNVSGNKSELIKRLRENDKALVQ